MDHEGAPIVRALNAFRDANRAADEAWLRTEQEEIGPLTLIDYQLRAVRQGLVANVLLLAGLSHTSFTDPAATQLSASRFSSKNDRPDVSAAEASEMLGIGLSTVYRWAEKGTLETWRVGKKIRFRREQVESLLRRES